MGIPIPRGRDFTVREMWETGGAVIVNEALARRLWPGQDPLGRRIKHGVDQGWLTVIGVAGDVRQRRLDVEPYPQIYVPYADYRHTTMSIAVRTQADPAALLASVRRVVQGLDRSLSLFNVATLQEAVERETSGRRAASMLLTVFASVSLALAVVGIYGVTSYVASQSSRDLALRLALGASSLHVMRHVASRSVASIAAGTTVGLILAAALARSMRAVLFEIDPLDPTTFALAAAGLFVVGLVACTLPARRAARLDPLALLRRP